MAIFLYVGINGSGKSYEAVRSVVIPAFVSGRRVVTNISGLSSEKITDYSLSVLKSDTENLGELVIVDNDTIQKENFFLSKENPDSFVKPGDLLVIDEAWRIFPDGNRLTKTQQSFFAEHRHFTNQETGLSCDVALITQSADELPKFIRSRTDTTFRMANLGSLRFSKGYKVEQYTGSKLWATRKITMSTHKYDPAIFQLYQSHDTVNGKSVSVDKRKGLSNKFIFFLIFSLVFFVAAFFAFPKLLNHKNISQSAPANSLNLPISIPPKIAIIPDSPVWRISGTYSKNGRAFVILLGKGGAYRLEYLSSFSGSGLMLSGVVDGFKVSYFTGVTQNES